MAQSLTRVLLRQSLKLIWCSGETERPSDDGSKKRKFILSFVFVLYCFQLYLYLFWDQRSANVYSYLYLPSHMLTNQPKSRNECDVSWTCDVWTRTARCMRRKMSVMCVCVVAVSSTFQWRSQVSMNMQFYAVQSSLLCCKPKFCVISTVSTQCTVRLAAAAEGVRERVFAASFVAPLTDLSSTQPHTLALLPGTFEHLFGTCWVFF